MKNIFKYLFLLCMLLFLVSCDIPEAKEVKRTSTKSVEKITNTPKTTAIKTTATKVKTTSKKSKKITKEEQAELDKAVQNLQIEIIKDKFKGIAKVEYDEKNNMLKFTPIAESFATETLLAKNKSETHVKTWKDMRDSFIAQSNTVKDVNFVIVNPANTENHLLIIRDGKVLYDYVLE